MSEHHRKFNWTHEVDQLNARIKRLEHEAEGIQREIEEQRRRLYFLTGGYLPRKEAAPASCGEERA
jgi:hypothetical protein